MGLLGWLCATICPDRAPPPPDVAALDERLRLGIHAHNTAAANIQGIGNRLQRELATSFGQASVDLDEAMLDLMHGKTKPREH